MPERGLLAPLSPKEEVTLRRLALGIVDSRELPQRDLQRLKSLGLVESATNGFNLTPLGGAVLPKAAPILDSAMRKISWTW